MGAWGPGYFDNDDAADFISLLTEAEDDGPMLEAFAEVLDVAPDTYLEVDSCSAAVAASEVVARLAGVGGAVPDGELDEWIAMQDASVRKAIATNHYPFAIAALKRVRQNSELAELWSEGDQDSWLASLDDIATRLASRAP